MVDVRLVHPAKLTFPGICSLYTTEPKLGVVFSHYPLFKGGEMCDCQGMGYPLPFSGCVECNVTLVEIRKGLFAVVVYMLPVVARGQGKGLTLLFQTEIPMGFYSFSLCMLRD